MTGRTDDGRYVVVAGRRWRAADPMIPPERAAELRSVLMAWRREVKTVRGTEAERPARDGVQAVKVALGERGCPWWERTAAERKQRWEAAVPWPGSRRRGCCAASAFAPLLVRRGGGRIIITSSTQGEHGTNREPEPGRGDREETPGRQEPARSSLNRPADVAVARAPVVSFAAGRP